ncbi:MFS general substrate transporter [Martensiomyces pterosporus]|nr:MFS general substrate transporter [Martensiomyces pterosporus]
MGIESKNGVDYEEAAAQGSASIAEQEDANGSVNTLGEPDGGGGAGVTDPAKEFPRHTRYAVIAGCFVLQGLSCGTIHSWGVQQEYLATHDFDGDTKRIKTLNYIGTLMYFGLYLWGMLAGWMAEVWSYRKLCFIGVVFMAAGQLVASFCREPWQFCLTQGIIFGFGGGLVFSPTSTAPARWFTKRRGLATGIAVAGVGVGGLVIAPLTEFLVRRAGVPWSARVAAIYIFVLGTTACYFVRVPFQDKTRTLKNFDWMAFRDRRFTIHAMMVFFVTAAYMVPYTYLPEYWTNKGINAQAASVLIAVANVASALGRVAMGFAADYIGVLNSLVLSLGISAIAVLLIWPFSATIGVGVVMGLFYGFNAGGYWTLAPLAAAKLFGVDKLASNAGIFYTISAVSAWLGNPVSAAILANPGHGTNFIGMIVYVGALWVVALAFAFTNRISYTKSIFRKA